MESVFLLWYVRTVKGDEDELLIGVYKSKEAARSAIERLREKPGFADSIEGFQICPYELDKDHWTEGFILVD